MHLGYSVRENEIYRSGRSTACGDVKYSELTSVLLSYQSENYVLATSSSDGYLAGVCIYLDVAVKCSCMCRFCKSLIFFANNFKLILQCCAHALAFVLNHLLLSEHGAAIRCCDISLSLLLALL